MATFVPKSRHSAPYRQWQSPLIFAQNMLFLHRLLSASRD